MTRPSVYLALGDSLAVGVGATVPDERGYVPQVARWLQSQAPERLEQAVNLAVGGETSDSLVRGGQLESAVNTIASTEWDVRVVTLDIGGNDLLALLFGGPCVIEPPGPACQSAVRATQARFAERYEQIVSSLARALAAKSRPAKLLVTTYYNPFSGTGSPYEAPSDVALLGADGALDCAGEASDRGLNDLIACIGARHGAVVADVYPAFAQRGPELTHILTGDIHANDAGHSVIAEVIRQTLESSR